MEDRLHLLSRPPDTSTRKSATLRHLGRNWRRSVLGLACAAVGSVAPLKACTAAMSSVASPAPRAAGLAASLRGAPKLGLGMAALGRPGYINLKHQDDMPGSRGVEDMRAHAHTVLDEAVALGVRYIDCARSYGLSEDFVASWLAARPPELAERLTIGSKWGYEYTAGWRVSVGEGEAHEEKKHTLAQFERQRRESTALLPALALYQIHSATEASGVLDAEDVHAALAAMRDEGGAGVGCAVGFSTSHPQVPTIERAIELQQAGAPLFGSVQATFNLLDQSAAAALEAAHAAGTFVIVKEALANGRLTLRAPPSPKLELLKAEAEALSTSVDALALAWVMSHPWVGMCLSGAGTVEQLRSNAEALRLTPLPAELQQRLGDALRQDAEEYWAERRALQWN